MKTARLAGLALILCTFPAAAATISGTVTPGAMTVAAYDVAGTLVTSATAAADGRHVLTVNAGLYRVLAYDPAGVYATSFYSDAESFETSAVLDVRSATTSINLTLVRAGFIAGTVTSASGARPNITVAAYNLSGTRRGFTRTDANGQYRLVLPPGLFKLVAYDETQTYATSFYSGQTTFAAATLLSVSTGATTAADFAVTLAGRIAGAIRDAATQTLLPNIRITAYDTAGSSIMATESDASGRYQLALPPGAYRLVFDDVGGGIYASLYWPDAESFDSSSLLNIAPAQSLPADAAMAKGGRLEGSVRDAATGALLPNITVAAFNGSGTIRTQTTTDTSGRYSLLVPPGSYRVGAFDHALTYATTFYPQQPLFSAATTLAVVASQTARGLDLALSRGGRVSGAIRDAVTSSPIAGMTVGVFDASGSMIASGRTRSDGSYRFVAALGTYRVIAFDTSLRYVSSAFGTVTLAADQEIAGVQFAVSAGAAISGNARDIRSGAGLGGIIISAFDAANAEVATTTSDAAGRFGFVVPAGTYRFAASDPLHHYATLFFENASSFTDARSVTVVAGQNAGVDFRLTTMPRSSRRRAVRR